MRLVMIPPSGRAGLTSSGHVYHDVCIREWFRACQADKKERDCGPCPCCKEHVEDVLLLEWKPLGLERMVDVSAFS